MMERFEFTLTWRGVCEDEEDASDWLRRFAAEHCGPTILEATVRPVPREQEPRDA